MGTGDWSRNQLTAVVGVFVLCSVTARQSTDSKGSCGLGQRRRLVETGMGNRGWVCCRLWNYTCPLNYFYSGCTVEGGWDGCRPCPEGFVQPLTSHMDSPIQCYKNTGHCDTDKVALNTTARRCMCDLASNHYAVKEAEACDHRPCPVGQQLSLNGSCVFCLPGSYKDWSGIGSCRPWRNCDELGLLPVNTPSSSQNSECVQKHVPVPVTVPVLNVTHLSHTTPLTTSTSTSPAAAANNSDGNVHIQRGNNELGIIGAFIVGGFILMGMIVMAVLLRKRACPKKVRSDQLYLEMNLRGRAGRHTYEQVQTSDDELDTSPTTSRIFHISTRRSRGGNRAADGHGCYGNLVISADGDTIAEELAGLTEGSVPHDEDGEESLRTSGGSIPFDNFLRLTPLDSEGQQLPPLEYDQSPDASWDCTTGDTGQAGESRSESNVPKGNKDTANSTYHEVKKASRSKVNAESSR